MGLPRTITRAFSIARSIVHLRSDLSNKNGIKSQEIWRILYQVQVQSPSPTQKGIKDSEGNQKYISKISNWKERHEKENQIKERGAWKRIKGY